MKYFVTLTISIFLLISGCLSSPSSLSRTRPTTDSSPVSKPGLGADKDQPITRSSALDAENGQELSKQLYMAVQMKEYRKISSLIEAGADPDIAGRREVYNQTKDITYTEVRYPLQAVQGSFHLSKKQQNDLIKVLLRAGADPNVQDKDEYTFFNSLVFHAEFANYKELIRLAVQNGADPGLLNKWGGTALEAVYSSKENLEERGIAVTEILSIISDGRTSDGDISHAGRGLSLVNGDGETLLFQAAEKRDEETARWLIDHGVSPKKKDKYGNTVLHALFRHGKPVPDELLRLFVRSGAEIDARGSNVIRRSSLQQKMKTIMQG